MKPHAVRVILCGVMLCASIPVSVAADQLTVYPARKIVTMDPSMPTATVVAVRDDRIVAVGTMETLKPWLDAHEFEIDELLQPGQITRPVGHALDEPGGELPVFRSDDFVLG